jgi:phenylpropionate dioxygenase-like ring-hydroxylating dioxygenase large terminal subunit
VIPTFCYSDKDYHDKEVDEVLMRSWLPAGRVDQLTDIGDYFTRDFFGESVVVVKSGEDEIRALSNVCRHRATQIVDNGSGNKRLLTCPYHKWVYNLDGSLRGAPYMDQAEGFDRKGCKLPEFKVEIWLGFIFINFDQDAEALTPQLEPLTEALAPYQIESLKSKHFKTLPSEWNWKASMENFTEAYHHIGIHPQTVEPYMPAEDVIYHDTNNAYSLFWLVMKDNKPMPSSLPDIEGLPDEYYYSKGVANVYPFLHLLIGSNVILWLDFDVKSVNQHDLVWHVLIPESTLDLPDFEEKYQPWLERMTGVVSEDIYACTKANIGQRSRFFTPGRFSHMEKSVYQMHNWLIDAFDRD